MMMCLQELKLKLIATQNFNSIFELRGIQEYKIKERYSS